MWYDISDSGANKLTAPNESAVSAALAAAVAVVTTVVAAVTVAVTITVAVVVDRYCLQCTCPQWSQMDCNRAIRDIGKVAYAE